jgi:TrmH family RNA methyltransferase
VRLVEEALAAGWSFRYALHSPELTQRGQALVSNLKAADVDIEPVAENLMAALAETETPQGILAVLDLVDLPIPDAPTFVLIPDSIRDPGNLGTLLRTAEAAGVQAVFLPPETTDAFAPKIVRAGMGAHFRLPIIALAWDEIQRITVSLKLTVILADMESGIPCWQADFRPPLALIIGGEAEGASQPARQLAETQVHIPMPGKAESLNAAIAGAVLMFEVTRQRSNG